MQHNILVQLCQHPSFANIHVQLVLHQHVHVLVLRQHVQAQLFQHQHEVHRAHGRAQHVLYNMSYGGMHSKVHAHITINFVYNTVVPVQLCIAHMHYIVKTGVLLHLL